MRVLFFESHYVLTHLLPNGFIEAGHEVCVIGDINKKKIQQAIRKFRPHLIITQGWGPEQRGKKPEWVQRYAKKAHIPQIYWSVEDPRFTASFAYPLIKRLIPDFIFTICPTIVDYYRNKGFKCELLEFAYEPSQHYPTEIYEPYKCTIALVANSYFWDKKYHNWEERFKYLDVLVRPLLEENIRIDFWGNGWEEMGDYFGIEIPNEWIHGPIWYTETNKIYNSADIVLGLQSYDSQLTHRTYEIIGSGGFLLTNDTTEIRRLFTPGKDLVVTASPEETMELVKYYLEHPEERQQVRETGALTVSQYTYKIRAEQIIQTLKENGIFKKYRIIQKRLRRKRIKERTKTKKIKQKYKRK